MAKKTEDVVRDQARRILGFVDSDDVRSGVGQITTFNQLGFHGVADKPDGWYLPDNHADPAVVLETKSTSITLGPKQVDEVLKNIKIIQEQYDRVVGVLYNGDTTRVFKGSEEYVGDGSTVLQNVGYYTSLFDVEKIDKHRIYELTAKINDCLHVEFGIKNLYHRMIFTACALVARRYDALMVKGMDYSSFTNAILSSLNKALIRDKQQNQKLQLLLDVFSGIQMNLNVNSEDEKQQRHVKHLIGLFIEWVTEISDCLNSDAWRGEDVMGIFFNEFNRYKKKSEAGQVFTPEHVTGFMYRILDVDQNDRVLDATCGSGGFLVKAMANMIQEAGGNQTNKAEEIKKTRLYGIEFDREIYALACANMLIHKDGKTNLAQLDARTDEAAAWIRSSGITKVLMNPPYEKKYGCMKIVENVLDNVPAHTPCAFILPEKKLETSAKSVTQRILRSHRLTKVIKMPDTLFFGIGTRTSIFVFESGVPQKDEAFFGCYMESDGLEVVKNKGRHDLHDRWPAIEDEWVRIIKRQTGHPSIQWIDPSKHLSYQAPHKPVDVFKEQFEKAALDRLLFELRVKDGGPSRTTVDTAEWGLFKVGGEDGLFDIHPTKAYNMTNAYLYEVPGDVPVVVNSSVNNGIGGYADFEPTEEGGIITFSDTTDANAIFYQDEPFIGYPHVQGMYPRDERWTRDSLMFFTVVFRAYALGMGFSYTNKFRRDIAAEMHVPLPITDDGGLDWDAMVSYMQQSTATVEALATEITRIS